MLQLFQRFSKTGSAAPLSIVSPRPTRLPPYFRFPRTLLKVVFSFMCLIFFLIVRACNACPPRLSISSAAFGKTIAGDYVTMDNSRQTKCIHPADFVERMEV